MRFARALRPLIALFGFGPTPDVEQWVPLPAPAPVLVRARLQARTEAGLARVLAMAEEKLARPECREIFSDFHDAGGRPLVRLLEETGRDGPGLLRALRFADGSPSSQCLNRYTLAWTHPGMQTVYLCGLRFADSAHFNPRFTANLLIHESLHSLGLGENPPASLEITRQVSTRCGY
jgi:hypothetical protein